MPLVLLSCLALLATPGPAGAAFPGSKGKIAFESNRDGGDVEVYSMNPDGTGQTRLTNSAGFDGDVAWSPDGAKIAFASERTGTMHVYVMNADGSGQTDVSQGLGRGPAWSPDGSRIAFVRTPDIWIMNADGSNQANLTGGAGTGNDIYPAWSPDGTKIAFQGQDTATNGNSEVFVIGSDGTGLANLTNDPGALDGVPEWAPDSSKLAYFHRSTSGLDPDFGEIYSMNADGSAKTALTKNPAHEEGPAWSPDATQIAFWTDRLGEGQEEVYAMNPDGSAQTNLTQNPASDTYPDWQPVRAAAPVAPSTPGLAPSAPSTPGPAPRARDTRAPSLAVSGVPSCSSSRFRLRVRARDRSGIRRVYIFLDGRQIASTSRQTFTVSVEARRRGRHRLTVLAIDRSANRRRVERRFRTCPPARPRFTG